MAQPVTLPGLFSFAPLRAIGLCYFTYAKMVGGIDTYAASGLVLRTLSNWCQQEARPQRRYRGSEGPPEEKKRPTARRIDLLTTLLLTTLLPFFVYPPILIGT